MRLPRSSKALSSALFIACASCVAQPVVRSVNWFDSFDLFSNFTGEQQAKSVDDIKRQLGRKWVDSVEVESDDGLVKRTVGDCREFFRAQQDGLEPKANVIRRPYSHIGLMCMAGRIILNAVPAKRSNVDNVMLDANIASYLPSEVAYRVSAESPKSFGKSWAEVDKLGRGIERGNEVEFQSGGAIHLVRKIASGDFNGDGFEDLLLDIVHGVIDGTHATESLYVMTRFQKTGPLQTLQQHSVLKPL